MNRFGVWAPIARKRAIAVNAQRYNLDGIFNWNIYSTHVVRWHGITTDGGSMTPSIVGRTAVPADVAATHRYGGFVGAAAGSSASSAFLPCSATAASRSIWSGVLTLTWDQLSPGPSFFLNSFAAGGGTPSPSMIQGIIAAATLAGIGFDTQTGAELILTIPLIDVWGKKSAGA